MSLFPTRASQIWREKSARRKSQLRGRNNRAFLRFCRPEPALRNSVAVLPVLLLSDFPLYRPNQRWDVMGKYLAMRAILCGAVLCSAFVLTAAHASEPSEETIARG